LILIWYFQSFPSFLISLIDESIVKWNWGNLMIVSKGTVDFSTKDENNKVINKKAAKNMAKYRVRCGACTNNFWSKCQVEPYHVGKTWREYKKFKKAKKCRFWEEPVLERKYKHGPFKYVCPSEECGQKCLESCEQVLDWKHLCKGFADEEVCLPCLHPDCVEKAPELTLDQNDESYWSIWYISGLGQSPSIQLGCSHIFHVDWIKKKLLGKWSGPRINFNYKNCPACNCEIDASFHEELNTLVLDAKDLEAQIESKSLERAKVEQLDKHPRLKDPNDEYFNDLSKYAMERLSYYECFKCHTPYFGGLKECGNLLEAAAGFKPDELVWGKWSTKNLSGQVDCPKHGKEYIEFKCRYWCKQSTFFCFGHTHFWTSCHKNPGSKKIFKCPGADKWGIKVKHPDDGTEFSLGCGLCRNSTENTF